MIALDTSPVRLALARHNAMIYGVADRIEFILADYISFANSLISMSNKDARKIDVKVFGKAESERLEAILQEIMMNGGVGQRPSIFS